MSSSPPPKVWDAVLICTDAEVDKAREWLLKQDIEDLDIQAYSASEFKHSPTEIFLSASVQFWTYTTNQFVMQCVGLTEDLQAHGIGQGTSRYLVPIWVDSRKEIAFLPFSIRHFKGVEAKNQAKVKKLFGTLQQTAHKEVKQHLQEKLKDILKKYNQQNVGEDVAAVCKFEH